MVVKRCAYLLDLLSSGELLDGKISYPKSLTKLLHPFMKHPIIIALAILLPSIIWGQQLPLSDRHVLKDPEVIQGILLKTTPPLIGGIKSDIDTLEISKKEKRGYHPKGDWPLNSKNDPTALPVLDDLSRQANYPPLNVHKSMNLDFNGIGNTNVNPADPCIAAGPNHVIQMINGGSGAYFKIFNKSGIIVQNTMYFDVLTGISGAGDPIVLYDELADRWLMSEFAFGQDLLIVAISASNDPTGSYHIYSFATPHFPDYPKYAIWPDAYYITTNEDGDSPVYALDRNKMLAGDPNVTTQRFTMPELPTIDFQAATPVSLSGTTAPPAGTPGMIMRMADDAWSTNIPSDRLEIWDFDVDFDNPANTTLSGPTNLTTAPFDSELCGYTSYSCIDQPNSILDLDPVREVLMNKITYRNFGTHQALVCNHVTDADGNDQAGIRWYELRNEGTGWNIYQQSTYAPLDDAGRWMAGISLNPDGSIGLAYNISSSTIFPGIRYTGRTECDPINQMTWPETIIKTGNSFSGSNRWGDYTCLDADPIDGSFWYTAAYGIGGSWNTHIANFEIPDNCTGIMLYSVTQDVTICQAENAVFDFELQYMGTYGGQTQFATTGLPAGVTATFPTNPANASGIYPVILSNTGMLNTGSYVFNVIAVSGLDVEEVQMTLHVEEPIMTVPTLVYPEDQSHSMTYMTYFEWDHITNADTYLLELAMDPVFDLNYQFFPGLATNNYTVVTPLNVYTTYYWRVSATNNCNTTNHSAVYSFTTGNDTCADNVSSDTPIVISSSGAPTIESSLFIPAGGPVTEISIDNIDITHTWISDLVLTLISPSGTEIIIAEDICYNEDNLLITFEDGGLPYVDIPCPPVDGLTYAPLNPVSGLINENAAGTWKLRIHDKYNMDGGTLNSWGLSICMMSGDCEMNITLNSNNPPIVPAMYQAVQQIHSSGTVDSNVDFRAGQAINLNPGFETNLGATFEAQIEDCSN